MLNNGYKLKNKGFLVPIGIIIIQFLVFIFLFPNVESPDISIHLTKVFGSSSYNNEFYFVLLNKFKDLIEMFLTNDMHFDYLRFNPVDYFSMKSRFDYLGQNNKSIMVLQFFNMFMTLFSIAIFNYFINNDFTLSLNEKNFIKKINYLYFIYPQTAYLITTITSDFFNYLFQPFFFYLIYKKKYKTNFLILIIMYIFFDQGIIINILLLSIFLIFHYIFKIYKSQKKGYWILYLSVFSILIYYFSRNLFNIIPQFSFLIEISSNAINRYGVIYTKIVNFFLSSFSFWGIGNFITFPIIYGIYLMMTIYVFIKSIKNKRKIDQYYFEMFLSFLFTLSIILVFFSTHSHVRFFMFWIPIFITGLLIYSKENKYIEFINFGSLVWLFFLHNIFLILFYSVKIFIL
jgi:hypothetical protein